MEKGKFTFTIIKPKAIKQGHMIGIFNMIDQAEFKIRAMKMTHMSIDDAKEFYSIHKDKAFFDSLIKFMSSGHVVVAVLEKENAVEDFRNLIGSTNPAEAKPGTIRHKYASSLTENAVHGSDSNENAMKEIAFFFSRREIFNIQ
ncbi:MAG TPA: nucleoside-diphosphate kinase [Bacteroidales bacterium]|nr:nucleoside-diphosphate kinase [Bacteroidales bacterium]HRW20986.1 nucleoside-diphosphate kinase [Bacteroidales bacterium]HXK82260.1 nucleoside-diphosphate kinase [Bacteroidales bacterium]